jgi:hypothetical protein
MEALEPDSKLLLFFYLIDLVYRCELLSNHIKDFNSSTFLYVVYVLTDNSFDV